MSLCNSVQWVAHGMLGRFSAVSTYMRQTGVFSPPTANASNASFWLWSSFLCSFLLSFFNFSLLFSSSKDTNKNLFIFAQTECLQTCHPCPMCVNNHRVIHPLKRRRASSSSQQHLQNNITFDQLDGILIKPANGRQRLALSVTLTLPTQTEHVTSDLWPPSDLLDPQSYYHLRVHMRLLKWGFGTGGWWLYFIWISWLNTLG